MCNDVLSAGVDYVFISKSYGSQENISQFLESSIPRSLLTDGYCRDQVYKIVCNYYLSPCGSDGSELSPSSICPEECSVVENACPLEWDALNLHLRDYGFIDCNDTSAILFPLPNCCTGVGIQGPEHGQIYGILCIPKHVTILFILAESKTSFKAYIFSVFGAVAGLLLVLVIVAIVVARLRKQRRRKKKLANWQLDIMAM